MDDTTLTNEDMAGFAAMQAADANIPADPAPVVADIAAPTDAPAVATETPADPAADPTTEGQQKLVPHAAMHEERERRKALEKRIAEQEQRYEARVSQLLQFMQQQAQTAQPQAQQPAAPQDAIPPMEQDPVGHIVKTLEHFKGDIAAVRQHFAQQQQQAQQRAVEEAIQQRAAAAEMEFRARTPDYDAATTHLVASRHRELELAGFSDPMQRQQQIKHEALGIAARALQMGRDPAEMYYELAKHRGYSAAAPVPTAPTSPAAAPAVLAAPAAAQQVAQIAAGQQAARTLGNTAGAAPPAVNANAVLNMSAKEFDAWLSKASPEQQAAVFGA